MLLRFSMPGLETQITRARTISVCIWSRWCSIARAIASTPQPCWGKIAFEFPKYPNLETLLTEIPDASAYRVAQYLDAALSTLTRFATLWKAHRAAEACQLQGQQEPPSLVQEGSTEPQQPSQPAQVPRRGETGPAQPREASEDATKQTAKTGADYDTTRFYLERVA